MPSKLNRDDVLAKYPWIETPDLNCILSPDTDGFLCGLFMSHFYDWEIKGYYDSHALLVEQGVKAKDCVFLDMEIARPYVRSVGQHYLHRNFLRARDKGLHTQLGQMLVQCASPNIQRARESKKFKYKHKYPFATIHFLMALLPKQHQFCDTAPLFFVDGTFKNLFNYLENCLDWLNYLDAEHNDLALVFNSGVGMMKLMNRMEDFFGEIRKIGSSADKLPLIVDGDPKLSNEAIPAAQKQTTEEFLNLLASATGWNYDASKWAWTNLDSHTFPTYKEDKPTIDNFTKFLNKNPLSWAFTKTDLIEYTLDPKGVI